MGVGNIPASIDTVSEILLDIDQRKEFDDMLDEIEVLSEYRDFMSFEIYITFKRILIVSPRDFCWAGSHIRFKNGVQIFPVTSVEKQEKPVVKNFVRADLHIGGWILVPTDDNNTMAYYYNRADMKGSIPAFIMKQGASIQALMIAKLRDYVIKKEGSKK